MNPYQFNFNGYQPQTQAYSSWFGQQAQRQAPRYNPFSPGRYYTQSPKASNHFERYVQQAMGQFQPLQRMSASPMMPR